MLYEKGQLVRIVADNDDYPYCIGKTGVVIDEEDILSNLLVRFSFELPVGRETIDKNSRWFLYDEVIPISREENIKKLLQKLWV